MSYKTTFLLFTENHMQEKTFNPIIVNLPITLISKRNLKS